MSMPPAHRLPRDRPEPANANSAQIEIVCQDGEDFEAAKIRMMLGPHLANARAAVQFAGKQSGEFLPIGPFAAALVKSAERVKAGNMEDVEATLVSQAVTLNFMFAELSLTAASNLGANPDASERYLRMALKAQNQSRMTLETLSNIKNPPVIYARQANIAHGVQQVYNGTMPPTSHARENPNPPIQLLEHSDEPRMDTPSAKPNRLKQYSDGNLGSNQPGLKQRWARRRLVEMLSKVASALP